MIVSEWLLSCQLPSWQETASTRACVWLPEDFLHHPGTEVTLKPLPLGPDHCRGRGSRTRGTCGSKRGHKWRSIRRQLPPCSCLDLCRQSFTEPKFLHKPGSPRAHGT